MKTRLLAILAAAACCAPLLTVTPMTTAGAVTPDCTFTPVLPKRISVGQSVVGVKVPLKVNGDGCTADMMVSTSLVRHRSSHPLMWTMAGQPDTLRIYASLWAAGRYRTTAGDCLVFDSDFDQLTCTVIPASTVVKFTGHVRIKATRHDKLVTFAVVATSYSPNGNKRIGNRVIIQRQRPNGSWKTIHSGHTTNRRGYVWTYKHAAPATYRAVSANTVSTFLGRSKAVRPKVAPSKPKPVQSPSQSCYPLTNGGNCYEPGEFCRTSDHGASGLAGNGEAIECRDNNGWSWDPV
jgi:hypothetical protein